MLSTIFYELFSALHFILTTLWLGIFIIPFLFFLVKHSLDDSEEESHHNIVLRKYARMLKTVFLTIFLYAFFIIVTMILRDIFLGNIERTNFKELLQKANQDETFYIDGKELRKPQKITDDLLTVESRSNHRTKHGSNSSGTRETKFLGHIV